MEPAPEPTAELRRAVQVVALLNLAYFAVEFAVAARIGAVSLFADSVDFLEDAAVNLLVLVALTWSPRRRAAVGMGLAGLLLAPAAAFVWTLWRKLQTPDVPDAGLLSLAGGGALAVNVACALLLARVRRQGGSLSKAAFLSARNDAVSNVAIIAAGLATAATASLWPDVLVGVGIAALNVDAARKVWRAAREERRDAEA